MTLYELIITAPPNTPQTNPVEQVIEIDEDMITQIDVLIPYGHMGLAGVQVLYGAQQIYPRPFGTWLKGDGVFIQHRINLKLYAKREKITVKAYNEDEEYSHSFYIFIHAHSVEDVEIDKQIRNELRLVRKLIEMYLEAVGVI